MSPNEDMVESTSNVVTLPTVGGGDQLLSELGRMLKENAEYKQRNEALEEQVRQLREQQQQQQQQPLPCDNPSSLVVENISNNRNNSNDENDTPSKQQQGSNSSSSIIPSDAAAALQNQILTLQGKNQASAQILASTKAENEKLLETIVQLSAENMILKDQMIKEEGTAAAAAAVAPKNTQDALQAKETKDEDPSHSNNENELENDTTTTATVEELQDTIEHLQQRLMHQVEEKLILQTQVETLEHLLIEEKGAFKSILESSSSTTSSKNRKLKLPQSPPPQQTQRQADIIREALERKKSKNLRARISTKVYNSNDQKIDVQAYQQLYEEQMKQKRLDQRVRKKPAAQTPASPASPAAAAAHKNKNNNNNNNNEYSPLSTVVPPPPRSSPLPALPTTTTTKTKSTTVPTVPITELVGSSPTNNNENGNNDTTPLHKIGTQHLTTRLWDFDDWEVHQESNGNGHSNETTRPPQDDLKKK